MEEKRSPIAPKKKSVLAVIGIVCLMIVVSVVLGFLPEKPTGERIVLGVNTGDLKLGSTLKGCPVPIGDLVGVVSGGNFIISDANGDVKTGDSFVLTDPILHSKGNYTIAADYKGNTAQLYNKGEIEVSVECEGKIVSVVTNANGFFAIATKEAGYDAVITVYRKNGDAIYRYRITNNTFVDMDISANNRKLVVTEASLNDGIVGSNIVLIDFNRENAESVFYAKDNLYVAVHFNKNGSFVCLGNEKLDIYRADGSKLNEISYGGRRLITADVETDDMICLGFESDANDTSGVSKMEIYDKTGKLRGEAVLNDAIEHIGVNGGYATVSHSDSVDVVRGDGKVKMTFDSTSPVKYAMPFENGKAVVVFSGGNTVILK